LDRILAEFKPPADPDQAPPLSEREPDSKPGEIYRLGPHRVMCGDSRDREQMAALMEGQMAAVYWGDPPWGVGYVGRTPAALTIANDDAEGLLDLLVGAFTAATEALAPGSPFYIASPTGPQGTDFRLALRAVGWRHRQSLAWVKNSLVLGHGDYHNQYEEILFGATPGPGRPGRGRHRGTRWYGGNNQSSVFFVDRPVRSSQHPTQKPVALITAQLRNSSRRGDLVLDSFAGSGSSLIASELLGRRCFAMELSPAYVDVIRRRYAEFVDGRS
jgi:DNA modification methylase